VLLKRWLGSTVLCVVVLALCWPLVAADEPKRDEEPGAVEPLTATSDGGAVTIAVPQGSADLLCFDNQGKKKPVELRPRMLPNCLALSPDGKVAAVGDGLGHVQVYRLSPQPKVLSRWRLESSELEALAVSPDGKVVAAGGRKKTVALVEAASGKVLRTLEHEDGVCGLRFSPDGKAVAVGTERGQCLLWSVETGRLLWETARRKGWWFLRCIAFFPDGKKIATSGEGVVHILNAKTGKELTSYLAHRSSTNHLAVSPDGKYVASCGLKKHLHVWDAENKKAVATEKIEFEYGCVAFSKDEVFVAEARALKSFDLKTKKLRDHRPQK
jgi:WD40 repeat protein